MYPKSMLTCQWENKPNVITKNMNETTLQLQQGSLQWITCEQVILGCGNNLVSLF